ncbi:MAG: tetratricopeptide repeat protein [bacterium]
MKKSFNLLPLLIISATSVKEITTNHSIWDRILAQQAQVQTYRGNRALHFNSYQEAVRLFTKAVRSNPKDPKAHRQLGVALYWTGLVDEAVEEYLISLALKPDDADTHQVLGIAYAWLGEIDKAQEEFETALTHDPHRSDAEMNLGSIWDVKGNKEKSIYHLRRAISIEPHNPLYHFQLGSIYAKYGDDQHALNAFKIASGEAPYYEDVYLEMGASYIRLGKTEEAKSSLAKALRLKPGDQAARLLLSHVYRMQGKDEQAQKLHRQALELTPGGETNRLSLATAFRGEKNNRASASSPLEQFRNNIEQIPHTQGAQITIEAVSENLSRIEKKLPGVESMQQPVKNKSSGFKQMIELAPSSVSQRREEIDNLISDLSKQIDNLQSSEDLRLNMDIKRDQAASPQNNYPHKPDNKPKAVYQPRNVGNDAGLWVLGTAWMRLIEDIIITDDLSSAPSRLSQIERGTGYLQLGQADLAMYLFKQLIETSADDVVAWQGLAVAYIELGEIDDAVNCYKQILAIEPKNRIARESIKWLAP